MVEQEERFKDAIESDDEMYSLIGETKYGMSAVSHNLNPNKGNF